MIRSILVPLVVIAMLGACEGRPTRAAPQRYVVEISGFVFQPDTLEVAVGDTVVWVNRDVVPHTATGGGGAWDSGTIAAGASWSFVVQSSEEGDYACALHPTMNGVLTVQ